MHFILELAGLQPGFKDGSVVRRWRRAFEWTWEATLLVVALRFNHKSMVLRLIPKMALASLFFIPSSSMASMTFCRKSRL